MSYSHEKKKAIKDRIENIKRKKDLIEIYKIIQNDKNVSKSENNNGIFLYFNNLKTETYKKLENYLNNISNNTKNTESEITSVVSETAEQDIINIDYGSKLRLSNKERNIIKKKQYDKILSESKDIVYTKFIKEES